MKFEPISTDHAAHLIGKRPWEISRDAGLLASAQLAAMKTYRHDTSLIGVDIYNVEVEAYGCEVLDPSGNGVPAAGEPIFDEVHELMELEFDPSTDGRMPLILEAARIVAEKNPQAEVRIPMSGPFTIASHLIGLENMICELFTEPESTKEALIHLAGNQLQYARLAHERGFKISLFESSVTPPLLSPKLFNEEIVPALDKIISEFADTQLIIGGNTLDIAEAITSLSPSYIICPVETNQEAFMAKVEPREGMIVRINMSPAVFLPGKIDAAMEEAKRVLNLAKRYRNTTIGTLIPFNADSRIIQEISAYIESGA